MPTSGARARFRFTKWDGRPHWEFDGTVLGSDEHGTWVGFPRGTHQARPGFAFDTEVDSVSLVAPGTWAAPTFHAPGIWCDVYVDMTSPVQWDGTTVQAVDLDLDVIRMSDGEVRLDDEDEFATHQVALGYPDDVVAGARVSAEAVLAAVRAGAAPYDGTHERWLAVLADLSR
ncbi:MAG: DUF402 domain-containing protein [Nocardioides sp.]|uniref:DUF402 domain-containing protein n=1 Tax=Nocardioides sp. TaxID=35761 RepID=UPI003F0AF4FB